MERAEQRGYLLTELHKANVRLLITKAGTVLFRNNKSGIRPLLEALQSLPSPALRGAMVADAVVGKASALLLAYAEVGFVASRIMSKTGAGVLRMNKMGFYAQQTVPTILGRDGNRPCPFEEAVSGVSDPRQALDVLSKLARGLSLRT